jgi:hypothetical protein
MRGYSMGLCSLLYEGLLKTFSRDDIIQIWFRIVEDYSTRRLTNVTDKLIAISGIAREFQRHTGDDYLAGLWRAHLLECIMWYRLTSDETLTLKGREIVNEQYVLDDDDDYLAPSWS